MAVKSFHHKQQTHPLCISGSEKSVTCCCSDIITYDLDLGHHHDHVIGEPVSLVDFITQEFLNQGRPLGSPFGVAMSSVLKWWPLSTGGGRQLPATTIYLYASKLGPPLRIYN